MRNCTIRVAKTKALISFAVTAKLICAFVFAYADCWFSHGVAHMLYETIIHSCYITITFTLMIAILFFSRQIYFLLLGL